MVYKRYIKKNGKLIGPYYYESYRDENGNVKKRYLGNSLPGQSKINFVVALQFILAIVALLALFGFIYYAITGNVVDENISDGVNVPQIATDEGILVVEQPQESPAVTDNGGTEIIPGGEQTIIPEIVQDIDYSEKVSDERGDIVGNNDTLIDLNGTIIEENQTGVVEGVNETIIDLNDTILNINETIIDTNETIVENVTLVENITVVVKTTRTKIRVGERVKWTKDVSLDAPETAVVEIPKEAEDVTVEKVDDGENTEVQATITGNVALDIEIGRKTSFWSWLTGLFGITGRVIEDITDNQTANEGVDETVEVILDENATNYVIEYYTEAPTATEIETEQGKQVVISAPDELNYTDVLSYTDIDEMFDVGEEGKIRVYWVEDESYVPFDAYDEDGNGKLDYIEWITPHLSNQTFDIIYVSSLVGYWTMDRYDSDLNLFYDDSVYGNNASTNSTNIVNQAYPTTGHSGNGTRFGEQTLNYLRTPVNPSLDINSSITLSAWVNNHQKANHYKIVVKPSQFANVNPWELYALDLKSANASVGGSDVTNNGAPCFIISTASAGSSVAACANISLGQDLNLNQWYHVAGVYNGSTMSLYINGTLVKTISTSLTIGVNASTPLMIGGRTDVNSSGAIIPAFGVNATIDDVMVFSKALSAQEISDLYGGTLDLVNHTQINNCGNITSSGTYYIVRNLNSNGTCIRVQTDGVTINGQAYSITGNGSGYGIDATLAEGRAYTNLALNNLTITGFTSSVAIFGNTNTTNQMEGLPGGNIIINHSTIQEPIDAYGGVSGCDGSCSTSGSGGAVTILNSVVGIINAYSGDSWDITATGGVVIVNNSNVTSIKNYGGNQNGGFAGGNAGGVNVFDSNVVNISSYGGWGDSGGSGNVIVITDSTTGFIKGFGGGAAMGGGGNGAQVTITNSSTGDVKVYGGDGSYTSGNGGEVNLINSTTYYVDAHGGSGSAGGNGGNVKIVSAIANLSDMVIKLYPGIGDTSGTSGVLTLNYTNGLIDTNVSYGTNLSLNIINRSTGEIKFLSTLNGTLLNGRLGTNTSISNNYVYIDSSTNELNISANVTLYNPGTFISPYIAKDGVLCDDCYNFTSLNAATVVFNVSSWSNYSIMDAGGGSLANESSENLSEWRMFRKWLNHTAWDGETYSTIEGLNRVNYTTGNLVHSSPVVANGYVYVGSYDFMVYQLNATNISQKIAEYNTSGNVHSSPAVANGYVYAGMGYGTDGIIFQLNATNISQMVNFYNISSGAAHRQVLSPITIADGYLYVGSRDNNIYQLNATNVSQKIANYTTGDDVYSAPTIANGYVYVGSDDNKVYQLNASNVSQKIAEYITGDDVFSSSAVANGYVYIESDDGKLYQLNASNVSQKINEYNFGVAIGSPRWVSSSPAVANGYVYVGGTDNSTYQLNASNVSLLIANYTTGDDIVSSPAVANGYVYVGSWDNKMYQLNATNISIKIAEFTTGDLVSSSPSVANGYVYVGSDDNNVYQLNATNISADNDFQTDIVPPNIIINSLGQDTGYEGAVTWNPSISWDDAVSCEYSYDNSSWDVALGCNNSIPYPLIEGDYQLYLRGNDSSNNVGTAVSNPFNWDTTPPSTSIGIFCGGNDGQCSPSSWAPGVNTDLTKSSPYTDYVCEYSYNNSDWYGYNCEGFGSDIAPPATDGGHTLYIRINDSVKLTGYTQGDFSFDSTLPIGIISVTTNPITQNNLVQNVTVDYNEEMGSSYGAPFALISIVFSGNIGSFISNGGSWTNTTQYIESFTHNGTEEISNVSVISTGAQDMYSNPENTTAVNFTVEVTGDACLSGNEISCCWNITAAGDYILRQSITNTTSSICLWVQAEGVSIDLQDFTITGSVVGDGIGVDGNGNGLVGQNFTITNGTVIGDVSSGGYSVDPTYQGGDGGNIIITQMNITGDVGTGGGSGEGGGNSGTLNIQGSTVGGQAGTTGGSGLGANAGNGGVIIIDSSIIASVKSAGGSTSDGGGSSDSGAITISGSTIGNILSQGGTDPYASGGNSGAINISTSTIQNLTSRGGFRGGSSGTISLTDVTADEVISYGRDGGSGYGGNSGAITLSNVNATFIVSHGGASTASDGGDSGSLIGSHVTANYISIGGGGAGGNAGIGGNINLTNSNVINVSSYGGSSENANGNKAGNIILINSSNLSHVNAIGGDGGTGLYPGTGGNGGNVTIDPCPTPLPTVHVEGGNGGTADGIDGTITPSTCNSRVNPPYIIVYSPTNTTYNSSDVLVNFTAVDVDGIGTLWYSNGTRSTTYTTPGNINLANGQYTYTFYANDAAIPITYSPEQDSYIVSGRDGNLSQAPPVIADDSTYGTILGPGDGSFCGQGVEGSCNKIFMDFDISSIPDDAVITGVKLKLTQSSLGYSTKPFGVIDVTLLTNRSSTMNALELQSACEYPLSYNYSLALSRDDELYNLNVNESGNITLDGDPFSSNPSLLLQNQLSQDFFSVCVMPTNPDVPQSFWLSEVDNESYRPQLIVTYQFPVDYGNVNSTQVTFTVDVQDITLPFIQFVNVTEENGSVINRNYINVNVSASDASGISNILIRLYNSTGLLSTQMFAGVENANYTFTGLSNGVYYINATAADNSSNNNENYTETRTIIVNVAPSLYCGDGSCNNGETCSTCSADCGSCGGPGGCPFAGWYNWSSWGSCINGLQSRNRQDNCGHQENEQQSCSILNQTCISDFSCGGWGSCNSGSSTRQCVDANGCEGSYTEQKECGEEDCTPSVNCTMGECNYDDKIEDIFNGLISYTGHKINVCVDNNGCIDDYEESLSCSSNVEVELVRKEVCGVETLALIDKTTQKEVTNINLEAWKQNKLNVRLVQGEGYCPSCYNGIKDGDEERVDCGGSCQKCKPNGTVLPLKYLIWGMWILLYLLLLLLFFLLRKRKDKIALIRKIIREGRRALHENHLPVAVSDYYKIKMIYEDLKEQDKPRIKGEILDYYNLVKRHIPG